MCLVVLFYRVGDDAPVILGANREEDFSRGGEPPRLLEGSVRVVAGVDPRAGGTWLGINEHGVVIALTNRRLSQAPLQPRSRGLLVRQLLDCPTAAEAVALATSELQTRNYSGCNILCVDHARAVVLHAGDWLRVRPLPPGLHVLANGDVNDGSDPRTGHALWWLHQRVYADSSECLDALKQLCGQTGTDGPAMCYRRGNYGTVSSSLIRLRANLTGSSYLHAQGPPDQTAYEDYSALLRSLTL